MKSNDHAPESEAKSKGSVKDARKIAREVTPPGKARSK
jgi:hypothetical protein